MFALVNPFVQIALLRLTPQQLPASVLLLKLTLVAHALLGVMMFTTRLPFAKAVLAGTVSTLVMCALTASLLYASRRSTRIVQTLTAMAGSDVVIGVAALPITAWLHGAMGDAAEGAAASGLPGLLFLILVLWNLVVAGHVLRHALSSPLPLGIVLALVLYMLSVNVMHALFPGMT